MGGFHAFPAFLVSFLILVLLPAVLADPATLPFVDCFDDTGNVTQKLNVSTVYAQVHQNDQWGTYLNLTVIGETPQEIVGSSSSSLATLFTTTSVLTLNAWTNSSFLCEPLRPPSPLPELQGDNTTYCPLPAGPFAFSSTIPWGSNRALTTLSTRLRAVDPSGSELVCLDVLTSPLDLSTGIPYGRAKIIFWSTIGLALAYWFVIGVARIVSAWGRGISRRGVWARAQSAGFILASAVSGERLGTSPALMRFCTPSMRDVMFHTQWCAILAMVAVEWPQFAYPLLTQTAWSTLQYNITLVDSAKDHHWNPLAVAPYSPPSNFADQFADPSSPLYINPSVPNALFTLPDNATHGISSFAYTLGVRPEDLFPNCLILFLGILAATIAISFLLWLTDRVASLIGGKVGNGNSRGVPPGGINHLSRTRSPAFGRVDFVDSSAAATPLDEGKSLNGHGSTNGGGSKFPSSRFAIPLTSAGTINSGERGINSHRPWWRMRSDPSSFHGSVLHGNLVRVLLLFHLPVTVFSCYQMTLPRSQVALSSVVLAALSFCVFSIIIPTHLVLRVRFTSTNKLYDETRTLLSYGPLYNHYRHGSQMFASLLFATNIAFGVAIGAGQKSGTAQAIIILVVEVISALVTSIWLPWGSGASMGLISFLFCVARIVVAVLLVILTPAISIGAGPAGWVAYGILVILALVYLALFLLLAVKLVEAIVRIVGGIGFDRSRHVVDSGLLGACGLLGFCGPRKRRSRRPRQNKYRTTATPPLSQGRDSDVSSYTPPAILGDTAPKFLGTDSRKGSMHSQPPPSVLRPEHANRPYKEDSEDEGYIMGAWQPFPPRTGYSPVENQGPVSKPSVASSGFSRVGGGRAHIDTPYAIAAGSTHTFPSLGQQSNHGVSSSTALFKDDEDELTPSMSNVARQPEIGTLPPGAMQPTHVRTKSQTAIVEHAGGLYSSQPSPLGGSSPLRPQRESSGGSAGGLLRPPSKFLVGDDDDDAEDQPKKKPWYHIRRHRPSSSDGPSTSEDAAAAPTLPVDPELGGLNPSTAPAPGRSFVVIRKPQSTTTRLNQANSSNTHPGARPPTR
ncbi:hypothetical protein BDQ12DRAFT_675694 [Crucibulum laeve]|uniref:TRP C-terminal domain-containing protein n=1 Tax=Crucibulum laeve TaxID=68775 RepID=A0A5C3MIX1_9AGAR|nr:hypothetical protein BDQ12DRAFT_675694 [Crucibulum laeve]